MNERNILNTNEKEHDEKEKDLSILEVALDDGNHYLISHLVRKYSR